MPHHLVGETMDKSCSHYLTEAGKLVQRMRGIYVDATDDVDTTVLTHAVRIARYLLPNAHLSAVSAVLLGPTRDGRLFLSAPRPAKADRPPRGCRKLAEPHFLESGHRVQRTRIRALEIIQNSAPRQPSLGSAVVADGMGKFHVDVSSIRQRFLEAFRLRSEQARDDRRVFGVEAAARASLN